MQICKIENCNQPIANRKTQLCHKHHLRYIRYGTTELTRELVDHNKKCKVEGCERQQKTTNGYCLMHYKRWKRKQPIDKTKKCIVCGEPIGHNGCNKMCVQHYAQWLRTGNPLSAEERKYQPYGNANCKYYRTTNGKYVHRVVAEEILGRKLNADEVVHHVNLNKLDNSKNNLFVCNNKTHLHLHRQLERMAASLIEDGIIIFKDGEYRWCE